MTDKEIYIDGVDVIGCEWFGQFDLDINVICTSNSPKKCSAYCKDNSNCYYKQLKRKEKECKCLKREKRNFYNFLTNKYNYGSFRPMWGAYLLKRFF